MNDKEYFDFFLTSKINHDSILEASEINKASVLEAFKIALDTRKFEIDLYWKRANYFWLFIATIFIGYCSTVNYPSKYENILMTFLGYTFSVCWLCVNRGSKFWQENWEKHIENLSKNLGYPIFGLIACEKYSAMNPIDKYPYSVSKVNQILNFTVILFWAILVILRMYEVHQFCSIFIRLCSPLILGIIYLIIHFCSRSFACKKKASLGSDTKMFYNY